MSGAEDLTAAELAKVSFELRQWLNGLDPSTSSAVVGTGQTINQEDGHVHVWANVAEELPPALVPHFVSLGLDAEEYMLALPGSVDRDQLMEIARDPLIIAVSPIDGAELIAQVNAEQTQFAGLWQPDLDQNEFDTDDPGEETDGRIR